MKFLHPILLTVAALVSRASTQGSINNPTLGADPYAGLNLPQNAFGATVLAYLYGFPLVVFAASTSNGKLQYLGTNVYHPAKGLNQNANISAHSSNVDTVYGEAFFDLAATDVAVTIPAMQKNRYYSFSFLDPYSDDFAVLGSVSKSAPGKYLLRPAVKTGRAGKDTRNCTGYVACIDSPTLNGLFLVRVAAIPKNQTDDNYAVNYVKSVKFTPVNSHAPTAPALSPSDVANLSTNAVTQTMQLLARLGDRNQPQDTQLATFLPFTLLAAGISNGTYTAPASVDVDQVQSAWDNITNAFLASPANVIPLSNNWTVVSPVWSGSFQNGTNIVARSYTGQHGAAENTAVESIYPFAPQDVYTLDVGEAYIVTFQSKPPVATDGFWSMTMYDFNRNFVPNPLNVFALGDRSSLTYPNGKPVYRGGNPATNVPFQILVQASDNAPPSNWTNNWLPSPTQGAPFRLILRLYAPILGPAESTYQYPTFTKRSAIN